MKDKRDVRCLCEFAKLLTMLDERPARELFGDDPCQAIRDALEIQRGASALLQAAYMDSEQIVTQLEMDLTTCEANNQ